MAEITAASVGKLREMTNAGLMDCKKALTEANGDLDAAVDILRKKGAASAAKKASRGANEGVITKAIGAGSRSGIRSVAGLSVSGSTRPALARLARTFKQAFVAMRYSQYRVDARPSKPWRPRHARSIVSCTMSSASWNDPSMR